jgi:hypothetical protein
MQRLFGAAQHPGHTPTFSIRGSRLQDTRIPLIPLVLLTKITDTDPD